jgi:hypothetical protein
VQCHTPSVAAQSQHTLVLSSFCFQGPSEAFASVLTHPLEEPLPVVADCSLSTAAAAAGRGMSVSISTPAAYTGWSQERVVWSSRELPYVATHNEVRRTIPQVPRHVLVLLLATMVVSTQMKSGHLCTQRICGTAHTKSADSAKVGVFENLHAHQSIQNPQIQCVLSTQTCLCPQLDSNPMQP